MTEKTKNYFEELNEINVNDKIEKKNGLSYLSWAWSWAELKKRHPSAKKNVVKNDKGWLYHTDGRTCWVEVSVTVNDIEETEYLPIMDFRNQAIPLDKVNSMHVNTSLQRAITKAIARHGLGLYIYAGEDLPEVGENAFGISKNLADETAEDMRIAAEEQRLSKLKTSLAEMGSIAEIDGYLEERNRLKVLMSMSQVNAAQAKTIIKNAKLAIDPEYRGE